MKPYFVIYSNYLICARENIYYLDENRGILKNNIWAKENFFGGGSVPDNMPVTANFCNSC